MSDQPSNPIGRPTIYSEELAAEMCIRLVLGRSLKSICDNDPDMPCEKTAYLWMLKDPVFLQKITDARALQAEKRLDEIHEIADNGRNDWMEAQEDQGGAGFKLNGEHIQRSRLRVDARFKAAELMAPKKYGRKLDLQASGTLNINRTFFGDPPDKRD